MHPRPKTEAIVAALAPEAGEGLVRWALGSAGLLKADMVPGECFVLTRDLIMFPPSAFLDIGIYGLCGLARGPRRARPWMNYALLDSPYVSMASRSYVERVPASQHGRARRNRLEALAMRDYVLYKFGHPAEPQYGGVYVQRCIAAGRLLPLGPYLVLRAKKMGALRPPFVSP
jgi:hypothetical protein